MKRTLLAAAAALAQISEPAVGGPEASGFAWRDEARVRGACRRREALRYRNQRLVEWFEKNL